MKPKRVITVNIHNYENMSIEEINALIDGLTNLRQNRLTERADKHTEELRKFICSIMDDGFVVYFNGKAIEPEDLDVRID